MAIPASDGFETRLQCEITRQLRVPLDRVVDSASLVDDLRIGSVSHITLVMDLGAQVGVMIPDAVAVEFASVRGVVTARRASVASTGGFSG